MRVMIAYDGSTYADAAIDDLARAGFPPDSDVLIASVADFSIGRPTVSEFDLVSAASRRIDTILEQIQYHEALVLEQARSMTSEIVSRLRRQFPTWNVASEVLTGNPAAELLRTAKRWNADLVMGGSQGRSAIGRFFLGSVSKSVAEKAACSVRVVRGGLRKTEVEPIEIIVGATNPEGAATALKAVARRAWPANTGILLLAVDDGVTANRVSAVYPYAKSIYEQAVEPLAALGLRVSIHIESGDPRQMFLRATEGLRADAIFVAAGKTNDQGGLDESASALVTKAKCTVEIVR